MWMTPDAGSEHFGPNRKHGRGDPTLDAQASQFGLQAPETPKAGGESSNSAPILHLRLNPRFVEWLMGIPIGWLSLEPLGMGSYRQWWRNFFGVYSRKGD